MRSRLEFFAAALCLGTQCALLAQLGFTPPAPLSSQAATDSGADNTPRIATDQHGRCIAVWSSTENLNGAGTDADIFYSTSADKGRTWSSARILNSNATSDSGQDFFPIIRSDGMGRWIAAWHSNDSLGGTIGSDQDILFSISTDHGATWSAPKALHGNAATDTTEDAFVSLETDGKGVWIAAWQSSPAGSDQDLLWSRSTDGGASWSAAAPLNSNASSDKGSDFNVSLSTDRRGAWITVWSSNEAFAGKNDEDNDLAFARSTDGGLSWSAPALLHSAHFLGDDGEDFNPVIRSDGTGGWVVVWESGASLNGAIGRDQDILFSRSINAGVAWSAPAPLNRNAFTDRALDSFPALATDEAGHWLALWHSDDSLDNAIGSDQDILFAYSNDGGLSWSAPFPLNSNAAADSGADNFPAVVHDGLRGWIALWSSEDALNNTIGTDPDILFATLDSALFWAAPKPLHANAGSDKGHDNNIRLAADGRGTVIAVWASQENLSGQTSTDHDIFVSVSTDNGHTWSAPKLLNSNGANDAAEDNNPWIVTDTKGAWIVFWDSTDSLGNTIGTDQDILFSVSADAGKTWSPAKALTQEATNDQAMDIAPHAATDQAGNWVVVWQTSGGTFGNDFDTLTAFSTNNGAGWSAAAPLNQNAANDIGDDFQPQVATDKTGQWIALWMSNDSLNDTIGRDDDILMAYSSNNGRSWTSPRPLNSNAATDQVDDDDYSPALATDGKGHWIAVWHSEGTLGGTIGTDQDILFARSADNGVSWSAPAALQTNARFDTGQDHSVKIAANAPGHFLVVWNSNERFFRGGGNNQFDSEILSSLSSDHGQSWSPPSIVNSTAMLDAQSEGAPHLAAAAGSKWIVAWPTIEDRFEADRDIHFSFANEPFDAGSQLIELKASSFSRSGNTFTIRWAGAAPPYQLQVATNLSRSGGSRMSARQTGSSIVWVNLGEATCQTSATVPANNSQAYYRIVALGSAAQFNPVWTGDYSYTTPSGASAVAETIYVAGFGLDAPVDVLISGGLPLVVNRTIVNNGAMTVPGGYLVTEEVQGWNFLAVGGSAGYVPGTTNQIVFQCQTTNTPTLAPGQSATITFVLGGPGCPPLIPGLTELPCGLYQETMTVETPFDIPGFCPAVVPVQAANFIFVNETNRLAMSVQLNPLGAPNVSTPGPRTVWVHASFPPPVVTTHRVTITPSSPAFAYFVRARAPITGLQAPTIGDFVPAIPQAPAAPLQLTGASTFDYQVTVVPAFDGRPPCNVIGIPFRWEEKVNTTITAIAVNGCAIAQRSILASGVYECQF